MSAVDIIARRKEPRLISKSRESSFLFWKFRGGSVC